MSQSTNQPPLSATMGVITIVMTLVGWSSIPLFLRYFSEHIDVWTSNGFRYGASALFWAPVLLVAWLLGRWPAGLWRAAWIPGLVNSVAQVSFAYAHYQIEPGLLTFGLRSQIIFAAIGAYLLFPGERFVIRSSGYLLGALLVLLGTSGSVLLSPQSVHPTHWKGVGFAILSGCLFACYGLSVRRFAAGINSVMAFAAISQLTAMVMILLMLIFGQRHGAAAFDLSPSQLYWLLVSALIGIALGHVFYYMSIARLGVAVSSGVLQLQPFLVAVASYLIFGEVLNWGQWLSGGLAIGGAILMLSMQILATRRSSAAPFRRAAEG